MESAYQFIRLNKTPYWWLKSGERTVGEYEDSDSLEASIAHLQETIDLLPAGTYSLNTSKKSTDRRGQLTHTFKIGSQANTTPTPQSQPMDLQRIYEQAKKDVQLEMVLAKIERYVDAQEALNTRNEARFEKIANALIKLTDDDPDNDESAQKDILSVLADNSVKFKDTVSALNEMFGNK
jgi:hypothetical protein